MTDALYRLTGGNPFYVTEVVAAGMAEVPASARAAGRRLTAPRGAVVFYGRTAARGWICLVRLRAARSV